LLDTSMIAWWRQASLAHVAIERAMLIALSKRVVGRRN
jgi:hypothetical protein